MEQNVMNQVFLRRELERFLAEDLGHADVPTGELVRASIEAQEVGVLCGAVFADTLFSLLDPTHDFSLGCGREGDAFKGGESVMDLNIPEGILRAGIRTQLNLMMHLCGIATKTATLVKELAGTRCKLLDTRKTLPGLRAFEKYAHRTGGGANHRFDRTGGVIIKKEDIVAAGSALEAVARATGGVPHLSAIEVEVEDPSQLSSLTMDLRVTHVLLDNMEPADVRGCVRIHGGRFVMEASGIAPERLREYAETGVPFISTSATIMGAKPIKLHLVMR